MSHPASVRSSAVDLSCVAHNSRTPTTWDVSLRRILRFPFRISVIYAFNHVQYCTDSDDLLSQAVAKAKLIVPVELPQTVSLDNFRAEQ
jgi:hypothetical protein